LISLARLGLPSSSKWLVRMQACHLDDADLPVPHHRISLESGALAS
jgi:hypothetical protein